MKAKVACVLLVDDDEPTNTLHKIILEEANFAEDIFVAESGFEALDFLTHGGKYAQSQPPRPNLIFLDINMPRMNGFEFLQAYRELPEDQWADAVVLMLTTSLNPDDYDKAAQISEISGFRNKPLTIRMLDDIYLEFFNQQQASKM